MHREETAEVLVVGAGPVGLLTALLLAEAGIRVRIIDQDQRPAAHSYACALHSTTLKLLDQAGVVAPMLRLGRHVKTMAFYDGASRRAELKLAEIPGDFPFALVLPQSVLENLLEQQLQRKAHLAVQWDHRLSDLKAEGQAVLATVDTLGETAKGYIVPEWEWTVQKRTPVRAAFVIGADGRNSLVRQSLGIEYEPAGAAESFIVYEFESETESDEEIRVVLNDDSANVLWPLPGRRRRWSFQVATTEATGDFPSKERSDLTVFDRVDSEEMKRRLQQLVRERAPWFAEGVEEIDWATEVCFERRLAKSFGRNRCWLVGDAAHQTGPVGVQSLNAGMREAAELVDGLKKVLRENAPLTSLETYNRKQRDEWRRLLGPGDGLRPRGQTDPWIAARRARLMSCLPASGDALAPLAGQLGLDV